jgi:hypothetical protein
LVSFSTLASHASERGWTVPERDVMSRSGGLDAVEAAAGRMRAAVMRAAAVTEMRMDAHSGTVAR